MPSYLPTFLPYYLTAFLPQVPLVVIEVQSGEYLGDDDIVRIDPAVIAAMQQRLQETRASF